MTRRNKPKGWRNEPVRHGLASQGIRTTTKGKQNLNRKDIPNKLMKAIDEKLTKDYKEDSLAIDDIEIKNGYHTEVLPDGYKRQPCIDINIDFQKRLRTMYDYDSDLELKVVGDRIYVEVRLRIEFCDTCGWTLERDWLEIENFDTLDDIVRFVRREDDFLE